MSSETRIVHVDAHVHFHRCCEPEPFLRAAASNFRNYAVAGQSNVIGALFLTETRHEKAFERIREWSCASRDTRTDRWSCSEPEDGLSLVLKEENDDTLILVRGRQIVTREQLEVLALGTDVEIEDGVDIREVIAQVVGENGVAVIPWGFGKWVGSRGRLIKELLHDPTAPQFYLGDSGNRPGFWMERELWSVWKQVRPKDISGSDPLPFSEACGRAGSRGFCLDSRLNLSNPARELLSTMSQPDAVTAQFGLDENLLRFGFNQVRMQVRKRTSGRHSRDKEC